MSWCGRCLRSSTQCVRGRHMARACRVAVTFPLTGAAPPGRVASNLALADTLLRYSPLHLVACKQSGRQSGRAGHEYVCTAREGHGQLVHRMLSVCLQGACWVCPGKSVRARVRSCGLKVARTAGHAEATPVITTGLPGISYSSRNRSVSYSAASMRSTLSVAIQDGSARACHVRQRARGCV